MLLIALGVVLKDGHEEHLGLRGTLLDRLDHNGILDQRLHDKANQLEQFILVIIVGYPF
jgi:hypothetical protein